MKACTKCGETKPLTEFYPHKWRNDVRLYAPDCKRCNLDQCRAIRLRGGKGWKVKRAAYVRTNSEKIRAYSAAYYSANKERASELRRRRRVAHPERYERMVRDWQAANPALVDTYKKRSSAKARADLSDCYVRGLLTKRSNLRAADIPQALIEAKRLQLQILHEIKGA